MPRGLRAHCVSSFDTSAERARLQLHPPRRVGPTTGCGCRARRSAPRSAAWACGWPRCRSWPPVRSPRSAPHGRWTWRLPTIPTPTWSRACGRWSGYIDRRGCPGLFDRRRSAPAVRGWGRRVRGDCGTIRPRGTRSSPPAAVDSDPRSTPSFGC